MQEFDHELPGNHDVMHACREMAFDATIEFTYFVTSPRSATNEPVQISRSLSVSLELWKAGRDRCLSVAFEWRVGDESGAGTFRLGREEKLAVRKDLAEYDLRNMVVRNIADRLFNRVPQVITI